MPLLNLKTPAAGIFGKSRNAITTVTGCCIEVPPAVEAFEADFLSYLSRLESSAPTRVSVIAHQSEEFSHS